MQDKIRQAITKLDYLRHRTPYTAKSVIVEDIGSVLAILRTLAAEQPNAKQLQHEVDSTRGLWCIDKDPQGCSLAWIQLHAFQLEPLPTLAEQPEEPYRRIVPIHVNEPFRGICRCKVCGACFEGYPDAHDHTCGPPRKPDCPRCPYNEDNFKECNVLRIANCKFKKPAEQPEDACETCGGSGRLCYGCDKPISDCHCHPVNAGRSSYQCEACTPKPEVDCNTCKIKDACIKMWRQRYACKGPEAVKTEVGRTLYGPVGAYWDEAGMAKNDIRCNGCYKYRLCAEWPDECVVLHGINGHIARLEADAETSVTMMTDMAKQVNALEAKLEKTKVRLEDDIAIRDSLNTKIVNAKKALEE